ncbi:MAG: CshA/CshB family fibrillar adhesin-related protein, partial [Nocardioides sp.]
MRWLTATLAVLLLTGATAVIEMATTAPPAEARYATAGGGRFLSAIDWMEWGAHGDDLSAGGKTVSSTTNFGGVPFVVSCTISNVSGAVESYRPGNWFGDGLDDLYNIGGTGGSNQLISGLANINPGSTVKFRMACSATLGGAAVPLQGLVMADAEASSSGEYVQATPLTTGATWRIIDRYRDADCTTQTQAILTGSTLRLSPDGDECETGPMAIGFLDGASSADIELKGGGKSAIALGVVAGADFGDAPVSYGDAGAMVDPAWSGGVVPAGTTSVSTGFTLSSPGAAILSLGANVDTEITSPNTATALGDDSAGTDDEDSVTSLMTPTRQAGTTVTQTLACVGTGFVTGWVDWNRNGSFAASEASDTVACTAGSATLTFTVPTGAVAGTSYLRLRIGTTAAESQKITGVVPLGEVEDYQITIAQPAPTLTVAKVSNGGAGPFQFTATGATIAADTVTTTTAGAAVSSTTVHVGTAGTAITVSETVPSGWRATSATCTDANSAITGVTNPINGTLAGFPVAAGGTASVTVPGANVKAGANITCTFTNQKLAKLTIVKTAIGGGSSFSFTTTGTGLSGFSLNPNPVAGGSDSVQQVFTGLTPGASYSVTEAVSGGNNTQFSLVSASCVDNAGAPAGSVFSSSVVNNATTFGSVTVNPLVSGADVVCTFVNVRDPRIVIVKQTVGGDGTFGFTAATTAGTLASTAPSITTSAGTGVFNNRLTIGGAGSATVTLTENAPASPYTFTSLACVNAAGAPVGTVSGRAVTLTGMSAGTEVTCTYINKVQPTIKLRKTTTNGTGKFDFTSSIFAASPVSITTAAENTATPPTGDPVYTVAPDAAVTITEAVPANWALTGVQCVNTDSNSVVTSSFAGGALTIPAASLPGGADLVCTFTNTRNARTLTVTKALSPTTDAGQFQMNANGTLSTAGGNGVQASATVTAGDTVTFAEVAASGTDLANYTSSYDCVRTDTNASVASGAAISGSLTMPDANVACTITNTRGQAQLRLAKTWVGAYVGDAADLTAAGSQTVPVFTSTAGAAAETDTSAATTVYQGESYTLSEALVAANAGGYSASDWSCSGGGLSGDTLTINADAVGSTITCTITNTALPASLAVEKTPSVTSFDAPGQTITYDYVLTNTGGATLFPPYSVTDDKIAVTCPTTPTSLAANASVTCTATYVTTQADVDAGEITNLATGSALDGAGTEITSDEVKATVTATQTAGISLEKSGSLGGTRAGDTVTYEFKLVNTGNVTLDPISVSDPKIPSVTCLAVSLAPGASTTCTGTYELTQADVDSGHVANDATAYGNGPGGDPASTADDTSANDSVDVQILPSGTVSMDKKAGGIVDGDGNGPDAGDTIEYTFTVTNTGNVTLDPISVDDPTLGAVACAPTVLAPGADVVCTATYTLTQADVDTGHVANL